MDYEIVATLGPKSSSERMWEALLCAGATSFRLNTSHLSLEQVGEWLDRMKIFLKERDSRTRVVLDLQGSKWRLGDFEEFTLEPGQEVELVHSVSTGSPGRLPVPHGDFFRAVRQSDGSIVLNDAKITLAMREAGGGSVKARVKRGGVISSRKGITCPSSRYRAESLGEKDLEILKLTRGLDFIRYAVSYVRDRMEMSRYRQVIGDRAYLIAKLERETAVEDAGGISRFSDELWLCRGDLGAEMGLKAMAGEVYRFSNRLDEIPIPVLLAGQVLEHMTVSPVPTRAEVCCLHDALARGYRGVVLSDETAVGEYPIESCSAAALFKTGGEQPGN